MPYYPVYLRSVEFEDDLAEGTAIEVIERRRKLLKGVFFVDHGYETGPVDCGDQILQRPAMADADPLDGWGFEQQRVGQGRDLEPVERSDHCDMAVYRHCLDRLAEMRAANHLQDMIDAAVAGEPPDDLDPILRIAVDAHAVKTVSAPRLLNDCGSEY